MFLNKSAKSILILIFVVSIQFSNFGNNITKVFASPISVGGSPYGIGITPDGKRTYVANFGSDNVSVIDTDPLSAGCQDLIDTITVGINPVTVAITSDGKRAYVTNYGSSNVSVIDTDPLSGTYHDVIDTITVGLSPHGIDIVFGDTRAYVNNHLSDNISVIDTDPLSGTYHDVIDTINLDVGAVPSDIVISPDGKRAYVLNWGGGGGSTISVFDTDPLSGTYHSLIDTIISGNGVHDLAMNSDGKQTYVTNYSDNSVSVIDTDPLSGTYHDVIDTITVGINPIGITVTPDDKRVYVTNYGSSNVSVIDTDPLSGTYHDVIDTITVGSNPTSYGGDFISPDGNYAFILNYTDDTVSVIDTDPLSGTYNSETSSCGIIGDVTNPAISTLSPVDNATGVATNTNLVITFDENVDVETGNIIIKRTSDDTTFATIDVISGLVTGTGTDTITINPSSDLEENTEYYIQIDNTAFDDTAGNSYAGINNTTTWSFTTTDETAPTITNVTSDKSNGYYTVGEVIDIDITFSEAVTSTGDVTITLETGATDRTCTFTVSNSTTGTCNYTVQSGDISSDLTVSSISGTIADQSANAMSNFVPATNLAANKDIVIDTTAPTVSITAPIDGATVSGSSVSLTANASDTNMLGVQFKRDTNTNIDLEDTTSAYGVTWDTTLLSDGAQLLVAVARDLAGNYATSTAINVTVNNVADTNSGASGGGRSSSISATCKPSDRTISVGDKVSFDIDINTTEDDYTFKWTKVLSGNDEDEKYKFTEPGKYYPRAEAKDTDGNVAVVNCGTITVEESDDEDIEEIEHVEEDTFEYGKSSVCSNYISVPTPIKYGLDNDIENVKKIQAFLNKYENKNLDINGIYDIQTETAVKDFQVKYSLEVLSPWGYKTPTGIVYITTAAKMNAIHCTSYLQCPVFTKHTKLGDSNEEVPTIKSFLNLILDTKLDTDSSLYDQNTYNAVKDFQNRYKDFVLKPWGLYSGTGFWYKTSIRQSNKFMGCKMSPETLENGVFVD